MLVSQVDPWVQTIRLLSSGSRCADARADTTPVAKHRTSSISRSPHLKVSLIERTTSLTVTIAWWDPTSCFYGAQIWRVASAKVSGICALSGQRIRRGDRIFHPQRSKAAPVNARAMILESALNAIEPLQTSRV
ncbi:DUF3331 domain-containing protein [Paraburkholderia sp. GAS334]|jgi:hypothetical protein|uniref:DUF3331 domain-containing protein n=1 Tax=Paraburkholderia sp. GAS334 TaxID=3035131 RepID=UPI003D1B9B02